MYQILEAHGMGIEVTAAAADPSGTRLASGAYDGIYTVSRMICLQKCFNAASYSRV